MDNIRFALPYVGLLAGGAAFIGGTFYVVTLAIGRLANRRVHEVHPRLGSTRSR